MSPLYFYLCGIQQCFLQCKALPPFVFSFHLVSYPNVVTGGRQRQESSSLGTRSRKAVSCSPSFSQSTSTISPLFLAQYILLDLQKSHFPTDFCSFLPNEDEIRQLCKSDLRKTAIAENRQGQQSKLPFFKKTDYEKLGEQRMAARFHFSKQKAVRHQQPLPCGAGK